MIYDVKYLHTISLGWEFPRVGIEAPIGIGIGIDKKCTNMANYKRNPFHGNSQTWEFSFPELRNYFSHFIFMLICITKYFL